MQKYREIKQHGEIGKFGYFRKLLPLLIIFSLIMSANVMKAQEKPVPKKGNTQTNENKPDKKENKTENVDPKKLAKQKEIAELKRKILEAKDASSRTVVLNTILMKSALDKDYIVLVNIEILVNRLEKTVLREWLDAMAAIGNNTKELLLSDYVANLLILRINADLVEKVDKILKSYNPDVLFKGINSILVGVKEITYENQNVLRFAIDLASDEEFFTILYQIKFISSLINILNLKIDAETPKENNSINGIGIIYDIIHKKSKAALNVITNYAPAKNDYQGWSVWWTEFQKMSEVNQYKYLLENAHKRFSQKNKELNDLREANQTQKLQQNAKSYETNAASLNDESNNVVMVALENIIAIVGESAFDEKNRNSLVKSLHNAWYSDVSLEVKRKIVDLYLKLGGCEANLRVLFSFEQGIEIRRYIVERLSFEGKDGASLDKLIQIINERAKYPADIPKAAIKGLGKWNNYNDERNIKVVLETLKKIITIHDEKCLEPITLANTINELARKFNISELITHLFEVKPFKPQQLVVLLLSAIRSNNSPELLLWLVEYERKNEYLTGILKDSESFIDLITTVFEIFEILKEPFVKPTVYEGLYDSLGHLYHNAPEGANGLFEQKLENTLIRLALPYDADKKFVDLSADKKKAIQETALIVPELLMKRNMSDFVLDKLLPKYPAELIQAKEQELDILKVRLGLRSQKWDQLDIFTKYQKLVEKKTIGLKEVSEDIVWSISLNGIIDERVAPRLIFAVQSVSPEFHVHVWKTVFEFADKQFNELKTPKGEIYIFNVYKMVFSLDSMKALAENPIDKNLQAFLKLYENAKISYDKWFIETETFWLKLSNDLNETALKFALAGENYRVVLKNLIEKLMKLSNNEAEQAKIWKFIDEISNEKNLFLPRYKETLPKNEILKMLKEMESAIKTIALR